MKIRLKAVISVLFLFLISGPANSAVNRDFTISHYNICVNIPEDYKQLEIMAEVEFKKNTDFDGKPLEVIICKDFYGVLVEGITVIGDNNKKLSYKRDGALLSIDLPDDLKNKEVFTLSFIYEIRKISGKSKDQYADFAIKTDKDECHINASITRTDNWFPRIKGTIEERIPEFRLIVECNKKFEVMASGMREEVVEKGNRKLFIYENYKGLPDRSLYFFASKNRRIVKEFNDGFSVILFVPQNTSDANIAHISDVIHKSYRFFEKTFGKIPGNQYKIFSFPYGYAGLFNSMGAPPELFTKRIDNNEIYFPSRILIHEVSHTWWGNAISANARENYWLYEGFAKYSEIMGIRQVFGVDVEKRSFYRLKMSIMPYIGYEPSIIDAGKCHDRSLQVTSGYYKGAIFLRLLENVMGAENFSRGMKEYVRTFTGKDVSTEDFIAVMQKNTTKDLRKLSADYMLTPGFARYTVKRTTESRGNGVYIHNFIIENVGDKVIYSDYKAESPIEIKTGFLTLDTSAKTGIVIKSCNKEGKDVNFKVDPNDIFPVMPSNIKGCGVLVYVNANKQVKFFGVLKDSPTGKAGIKDGMELLEVNGEKVTGKELEELNRLFLMADGEKLKLLINPGDDKPRELIISY